MKGYWGHRQPGHDWIKIVLLLNKQSALCMGRTNEKAERVSLTEWHSVTFQNEHFDVESGWVVSLSCNRVWNDENTIAMNSISSRLPDVKWSNNESKSSSVRAHLWCVPMKPWSFLIPVRVCVTRILWWFFLMCGKWGLRELMIPERYCITETSFMWCDMKTM